MTGTILGRLFDPAETKNEFGHRVFGLYNGTDGIAPPQYLGRTFPESESRGYFHQYMALSRNRPAWHPMIGYYAQANDGPKRQAIQRLAAYYNSPPVPGDQADRVRKAMRMWMSKNSGALITDLNAALPAAP